MLVSLAIMLDFEISKIDVKSAFLQTVDAQRDAYVVPLREY